MTSTLDSYASPAQVRGRLLAVLGVFALLFTLVAPFAPQATASHGDGEPDSIAVDRLEGENRNATACEIALDTFDAAGTVILTRADDFPDTLSGNYLAGQLGVPVLITPDFDEDPTAVDSHTNRCLDELGTENVIIVGGDAAVPESVEDELDDRNFDVTRIAGANREETARFAATGAEDDVVEREYGTVDNEHTDGEERRTAIVARADHFVDALVAGAASYDADLPLLLTPRDELSDHAAAALDEMEIEHVLISGGTAAVSEAVELEIVATTNAESTERVSGVDRAETATEWVDWSVDNLDWTRSHVNLARGDHFPDALTMGSHAGEENHGIIVSASNTTFNTPQNNPGPWVREYACDILSAHIAGGDAAISDQVQTDFEEAADDCPEPGQADDITLSPQEATNEVGEDHTLTATVTGEGQPFSGAEVRFEVTGTTETTGTDTTDGDGEATFTYSSDDTGEDTITACTNEDGSLPDDCDDADLTDTATKTWVEPAPVDVDDLVLTPQEATNDVGETHEVTATVTHEGEPADGARVLFEVTGAHETTGTAITEDGDAHFGYPGTEAGEDTITACTNVDGSLPASCDQAEVTDTATKTWEEPPQAETLELTPQETTNVVETTHTVTATVEDQNGQALEDAEVRFEVYREGPLVVGGDGNYDLEETGEDTTLADGTAQFAYLGPDEEVDDFIVACVVEEGDDPGDGEAYRVADEGTGQLVVLGGEPQNIVGDRVADHAHKEWVVA